MVDDETRSDFQCRSFEARLIQQLHQVEMLERIYFPYPARMRECAETIYINLL